MKRKILITGASGGLISEMLKDFDRNQFELALQFFERMPIANQNDYIIQADWTQENAVEIFWKKIAQEWGMPDIILHAAGISINGLSWKVSKSDWQKTMDINLNAPFFLTQKVIPNMREKKFGRIIFFSSIVAQTGVAGTSAYAASKSALWGLTKTLATELAPSNITVNALSIGYFSKGMITQISDEARALLQEKIPLKRLGEPSEIKSLIDYLISESGSYVTGQVLNINGGLYS